ncbi:sugar ABC transporter ATP-binding protein [Methylobacterium brachiatum]|uniref:sugar ABC transporter ATP-binding protein n=1 Tax=Methylobacterium brachiatum TaxID=269660 RepID=UPI002446CBC4|nr:sugar ABC transporter ATP-binding protein [Methylobacterium brachiatum]MDH2313603.1 sugar ABC transporter ATP-binding protein [Methylobacterium brachiatum]
MSGALQIDHSRDAEPAAPPPRLELRGVVKHFPGVRALDGVDLVLRPGRVTALIGENGAGKSTLVKILTGIHRPDAGEIRVGGRPVSFTSPQDAQTARITAIHQETVLFDELTVAENIYLGHAPKTQLGFVDWSAMRARSAALLYGLDAPIRPWTRLRDLSIAQRHLVAIARALSIDSEIVIMDEPTAALSHKEVDDLARVVERLKGQGKAILFISHKFEELYRIADDYTVFRDGRSVGAGRMADVARDDLVRMMVGRSVDQVFPKAPASLGEPVLEVAGLSHPTEFDGVTFSLRRGEILGLYGLVGAGRSELCQALFGATAPSAGTIAIDGRPVTIRSPADAVRAGIVYVPEERGRHGAVLSMPVFENVTLACLGSVSRYGFIQSAEEFRLARHYAERLDLRAASLAQPVGTLSGGNQQKVVIGKWLAAGPKVVILDEPTKGIDIGSKAAVHAFMSELATQGLAVLMVSSELPEILGMADRVMVMREGRMAGLFPREGLTAETLVAAATGNTAAGTARSDRP